MNKTRYRNISTKEDSYHLPQKSWLPVKSVLLTTALIIYSCVSMAQSNLVKCKIKNLASGKYLCTQNGSTDNGVPLVQYTDNGGYSFMWYLTYYPNGNYYTITNYNGGKAIELMSSNQAAGTIPSMWDAQGSINQQWKFIPEGTNAYVIQSNMSNHYVLDNPASGTAQGASMAIYPLNGATGSPNQQWTVEPVLTSTQMYSSPAPNLALGTCQSCFSYIPQEDVVLKMMKLKIVFSPLASFFQVLTFTGTGGYTGLQYTNDNSKGDPHWLISSMWDSQFNVNDATSDYAAPGVDLSHGNSEGSAQTSVYGYGWQPGVYYNLVVRAWRTNGRIYVATFINDPISNTWFHEGTMSKLDDGTYLHSYNGSFIEEWLRDNPIYDGRNMRKAFYKDYWAIQTNGAWVKPLNANVISSEGTAGSQATNGIYDNSVDAGYDAAEGAFYMQTGGLTQFNPGFTTTPGYRVLTLPLQPNQPAVPTLTVGTVTNFTAGYSNGTVIVNWTTDNSKSPQLFSKVEILNSTGVVVASNQDTVPQRRSMNINANLNPGTYTARITIIDIFNQVSVPKTVTLNATSGFMSALANKPAIAGSTEDLWNVYPNPNPNTGASVHVDFKSSTEGAVAIEIKDLSGRSILRKNYPVTLGVNTILVPTPDLPNGVYILTLTQGTVNKITKLVIAR